MPTSQSCSERERRSLPRLQPTPPTAAFQLHRTWSLRDVGPDGQQGAVAIRLLYFHGVNRIASALDADLLDAARDGRIGGSQQQLPLLESALELHLENTLQGGAVARERGADAIDEWHDLW